MPGIHPAKVGAICVGLIGVFVLGYFAGQSSTTATSSDVLDHALGVIAADGANPATIAELRQAAVSGMLNTVHDPWGSYLDATQNSLRLDATAGAYAGIGAWLHQSGTNVAIANVTPGGPAQQAGLAVGDVVTRVGGEATSGLTAAAVGRLLTGDPNTIVDVTVHRAQSTLKVRVLRQSVDTGAVTVHPLAGGVIEIRVPQFSAGAGKAVRAAVATPHATGFILDLRGNPGGLLVEGVDTASAFLNGGPVVTLEKRGAKPVTFTAPKGGSTLPVVVLVDHGTASAAEIVAGALQDRGRAVLVGQRTFGKAAVQETFAVGGGAAIELTVGHYLTPNGNRIDGVGLIPDLVASNVGDDAVQRALAVLSGYTATAQ